MPFVLYAILVASGFAHITFVEFNNRLMKNFNIKPMNGVGDKLVYSWIHSRGTNIILEGLQANAERAVEAYDTHVAQPVGRAIDSAVIEPAKEIIGRCRTALGSSAQIPNWLMINFLAVAIITPPIWWRDDEINDRPSFPNFY
ncbi:MAG: hypothetical protein IPJ71_19190 [Bdellovibrionales bacterium]|nr:hypothetical protein [Bdellovibrionales bacterium]